LDFQSDVHIGAHQAGQVGLDFVRYTASVPAKSSRIENNASVESPQNLRGRNYPTVIRIAALPWRFPIWITTSPRPPVSCMTSFGHSAALSTITSDAPTDCSGLPVLAARDGNHARSGRPRELKRSNRDSARPQHDHRRARTK
jgi:hypothetical protein